MIVGDGDMRVRGVLEDADERERPVREWMKGGWAASLASGRRRRGRRDGASGGVDSDS